MKATTEITILVPHRISGFFQIVESGGGRPVDELSHIGSMGGGPSLSNYGRTKIRVVQELNSMEPSRCTITINGNNSTKTAMTTFYVFSHYTSLIKHPVNVEIYHEYELPLGAGYGSSGCGAIGTSFGLNLLLNVGLSYNQAGKIAHVAEVMNKTGLGTVGGQLTGGISITTKAGYPFVLDRIFYPANVKIVCGSFGSIPTQSIIGDPLHKTRIKKAGAFAMNTLLKNPIFSEFIRVSQQFVQDIQILESPDMHEVKDLINSLNKLDVYGASMNQLGKSVYCFCEDQQIKQVKEVFQSFSPSFLMELDICQTGPLISLS